MKGVIFIFLSVVCCIADAMPARRQPFIVKQSDGTELTVTLIGDETFHFIATLEGVPVVKAGDGTYRPAPEMKEQLEQTWAERKTKRNAHRLARAKENHNATQESKKRSFGHPTRFIGKKKGLVILVNYLDKSMKTTSTQTAWDNQFNERGYSKNNCIGSVHDYFYDQSYGLFDIEFDVIGPVNLSKPYTYYGKNNTTGEDAHACEMVIEACQLAEKKEVNFKDYDWDEDGTVDMVYIIYAGYGEHAGGGDNTIWPHEWELSSGADDGDGTGAMTLDGVTIDTYAVSCELRGTTGSKMDGIGIACHEFSHCLGLPDMYNTSTSGGFGMSAWDLLDAGAYNGPGGWGEVPSGFTAYERNFAGWLDYTELDRPCDISNMPALQDSAVAYIIYNEGNRNEYYICENRQSHGWFSYVNNNHAPHGMLVYHVDYDAYSWEYNEVNNKAKHQRMSIIPAGKDYGRYLSTSGQYSPTLSQFATQLFPGDMTETELTDTSHEAWNGRLFNRNTDGTYNMSKPLTDISEDEGLISFSFMGGAANCIEDIMPYGDMLQCIPEEKSVSQQPCQLSPNQSFFTLSGTKVKQPVKKGIYIIRENGKTCKVVRF